MKSSIAALALIITASSATALAHWHKEEVMQDRRTARTELPQGENTVSNVAEGEAESKDKATLLNEVKSK